MHGIYLEKLTPAVSGRAKRGPASLLAMLDGFVRGQGHINYHSVKSLPVAPQYEHFFSDSNQSGQRP